jgi:hypothetical protein
MKNGRINLFLTMMKLTSIADLAKLLMPAFVLQIMDKKHYLAAINIYGNVVAKYASAQEMEKLLHSKKNSPPGLDVKINDIYEIGVSKTGTLQITKTSISDLEKYISENAQKK